VRSLKRVYQPLLEVALRRRMVVLALAVAALLGSLAIVPQLGSEVSAGAQRGCHLGQPDAAGGDLAE